MKTKLIIIWVGAVLLVGMCLYPPWHIKTKMSVKITGVKLESVDKRLLGILKGKERKPLKRYKYSFLFSPPKEEFETIKEKIKTNIEGKEKIKRKFSYDVNISNRTKIDRTRLGLQLLVGIVLIGGALFTLSVLEKNKELEVLRKRQPKLKSLKRSMYKSH